MFPVLDNFYFCEIMNNAENMFCVCVFLKMILFLGGRLLNAYLPWY